MIRWYWEKVGGTLVVRSAGSWLQHRRWPGLTGPPAAWTGATGMCVEREGSCTST